MDQKETICIAPNGDVILESLDEKLLVDSQVMMAWSPPFKPMIEEAFRLRVLGDTTPPAILLDDDDPDSLNIICQFVHTGTMPDKLDTETLLEMGRIFEKYLFSKETHLYERLCGFLDHHVAASLLDDSLPKLVVAAYKLESVNLFRRSTKYALAFDRHLESPVYELYDAQIVQGKQLIIFCSYLIKLTKEHIPTEWLTYEYARIRELFTLRLTRIHTHACSNKTFHHVIEKTKLLSLNGLENNWQDKPLSYMSRAWIEYWFDLRKQDRERDEEIDRCSICGEPPLPEQGSDKREFYRIDKWDEFELCLICVKTKTIGADREDCPNNCKPWDWLLL